MGALKYTITVESDAAPQILIGQNLGGATVVGMRQEKIELVSATDSPALALSSNIFKAAHCSHSFAVSLVTE